MTVHDAALTARLAERQAEVEDFLQCWYAFVGAWRRSLRDSPETAAGLVARVLQTGWVERDAERAIPAADVQVSAARSLVAASGLLDADEYTIRHRLRRNVDPIRHFVDDGWRLLENPSPRFDLWSYWATHLDPTDDRVNPVLHYLLRGRSRGMSAVPENAPIRTSARLDVGVTRRVCLFAAHDRDGLVDDYVVDYLAELSRHADVFYLADGVLEPGQLDRVATVTQGAWSIPHGAYDFGSFSLLARDLVGWETIDGYDELVLANDSCFLVRPLDEVFSSMDNRATDWWSLQATSMEHDEHYFLDDAPIPLAEAKRSLIGPRKWTDVRYVHLSSYFLVFRRPVIEDEGFRWRLDTVVPQRAKGLVVSKYEVGISRYLIDAGFDFDTWLDGLHAFHPLYSRHVFDLIDAGFPLVKRNFLGENPRHVPGVGEWSRRLIEAAPGLDVERLRDNLQRVTDPARLHDAYTVTQDPTTGRRTIPVPPQPATGLRRLDRETPTFDHWWAFPAGTDGRLDPGLRAVFEVVRHDPTIRKVVLPRTRGLEDDLLGDNLQVVPLGTLDGQEALVRCGVVLVAEAPDLALPVALTNARRRFVHVGIGLADPGDDDGGGVGDWAAVGPLAVTSPSEALLRTATEPGLSLERTSVSGLPRHDLLVVDSAALPADLARAESALRARLNGRPLVVWWPHPASSSPYSAADVARLAEWVRRWDVVVGVREDVVDRRNGFTYALAPLSPLSLGGRSVMSSALVHRVAAAVVSDSSPEARDALVTGVPMVELWHAEDRDPVSDLLAGLDAVADRGFARVRRSPADAVPFDAVPFDGAAARRLVHRLRSQAPSSASISADHSASGT